MSVINKELYDALIQANVSDDLATKAAKSVSEENTMQLRLFSALLSEKS